MTSQVFDKRVCTLGEGPLWHPLLEQLFWFDILSMQLLTQKDSVGSEWQFEEYVSAAGWIDKNQLLLASETGLYRFDILTGARELVVELESNNVLTRSNDGRADPWGGFWIGTMGKNAELNAGAIYRFHKGELRKVVSEISISNAICFSPDRTKGYFCDTKTARIMSVELNIDDGWPESDPQVFIDLSDQGLNPDGAVVDSDGCLWNAQWGAGRVARYAPNGNFMSAIDVDGSQASCPAFGGPKMGSLFVTTAQDGLSGKGDGLTYQVETQVVGQREHRVLL
jgi:sugar lactone lactonase YvrE